MSYACPICAATLQPMPRYPRYVCEVCADRAAAPDGRKLVFSNEGLSGGFLAHYADTGERYDNHACWIGAVRCRADEARFGGIVIEVQEEQALANGDER